VANLREALTVVMASLLGTAGCGGHSEEERPSAWRRTTSARSATRTRSRLVSFRSRRPRTTNELHAAWQDPVKLNERLVKTDTKRTRSS